MAFHTCPVCGYPGVYAPAADPAVSHAFRTCPSCGFQFGYTDDVQGFSFEQWRDLWIVRGMPWEGRQHPPDGWDSRAQLLRAWPDAHIESQAMLSQYASGGYALRLTGFEVSRCLVDFAFTLHLVRDDQEVLLRVEGPFQCSVNGKKPTHCDPERDPAGLGPALLLLRHSVEMGFIGQDGTLRIVFRDQTMLVVPSETAYEAWTLNGPDRLLIVGGPEGRTTIFPPDSTSTSQQV